MTTGRRNVIFGLAAVALAGCGGGAATRRAPDTAMRAVPNPAYDAWVASYKSRAAAQGISQATLSRAFQNAGYLPGVVERDRNQTEFSRTTQDYLAIVANDERVSEGRAKYRQQQSSLSAIQAAYGVEPQVVTAIWGVESRYGTRRGDIPVVSALSTLAYDGRRGPFFEQQLTAALKILDNGDTTPDRMQGSWAGAMGHTQFIPTSYLEYAVDFTGDGRRDIWDEDPTDALASTAAYLRRFGWTSGQPWGVEVRLPAGFAGPYGRGTTRSPSAWAAMGVRDMDGNPVPDYGPASILRPAGAGGPAFMVFRNFTVITRYNNSENYVIGVGYLSDRIAGKPPIRASFPPDAQGLTLADRQELQRRLTAAGFDTQGTDGVIGANTEAAIAGYQRRAGLPVTGVASPSLLASLR